MCSPPCPPAQHPLHTQLQEECAALSRGEDTEEQEAADAEAEKAEEEAAQGEGKRAAGGKGAAAKEGGGEQEQLEEEEENEEEDRDQRRRSSRSLEETFEQELIAQLEEYEQVIQEFQAELEVTRTRYLLATGGGLGAQEPPEGGWPGAMERLCLGFSAPCPLSTPSRCSRRGHHVFTTPTGLPGIAAADVEHGE